MSKIATQDLVSDRTLELAAAEIGNPVPPQKALLVTLFACSDGLYGDEQRRLYCAMRNAVTDFERGRVAEDLVTAYCICHNIAWKTIRVLSINHYDHGAAAGSHYAISAHVTLREENET